MDRCSIWRHKPVVVSAAVCVVFPHDPAVMVSLRMRCPGADFAPGLTRTHRVVRQSLRPARGGPMRRSARLSMEALDCSPAHYRQWNRLHLRDLRRWMIAPGQGLPMAWGWSNPMGRLCLKLSRPAGSGWRRPIRRPAFARPARRCCCWRQMPGRNQAMSDLPSQG